MQWSEGSDRKKFDFQLGNAQQDEARLADLLSNKKIELKSESYQWERTGNICIEYEHRGAPSGIAVTAADIWMHELKRDGKTLVYLHFPIERLKELCRDAYRRGMHREGAGDGGRSKVVLLPLTEILR